jgi:hypothetical protein
MNLANDPGISIFLRMDPCLQQCAYQGFQTNTETGTATILPQAAHLVYNAQMELLESGHFSRSLWFCG